MPDSDKATAGRIDRNKENFGYNVQTAQWSSGMIGTHFSTKSSGAFLTFSSRFGKIQF
jgi:hypothetical protein